MSDARVAALVCEGQTDVPILRAIIHKTWPEIDEVRCLQPELDEMERARGAAGWTGVREWCRANAGRLDELVTPDIGDPMSLVLVALDVDIAVEAGIENPPKELGRYETRRLRSTVRGWLESPTVSKLPGELEVTTPVMAIEAWIIAALFPKESAPEAITDPTQWLVRRKTLRTSKRDGKPWKELHVYRELAPRVAGGLKQMRRRCKEVDRLVRDLEQRRASTK